MNKIKSIIAAMLLGVTTLNAQQASIPNVLNFKSAQSSGEIFEKDKLVGYYVFYNKEKVDKKNTAYEIKLFDDNYNPQKSFEVVRPASTMLLEMVFNGEAFLIHFYDKKIGYEFVSFDKTGKVLGSHKVPKDDISKWDLQRVEMAAMNGAENITIFPSGTTGFIRTTFTKNKKVGYDIVAFDNNAKKIWSVESDANSPLMQMADITDVSEKVITVTIARKKNLLTKEVESSCLLLNPKTGSVIREIDLGSNETGARTILKSFVNEKTATIVLVGEFFKVGDNSVKDKSQGIYLQELGLDGKELTMKQFKWKGDIDKFKVEGLNGEDKKERPFYSFIHDVIIAENGHIFLIGEQFIKQASAKGIAAAALGGLTGSGSGAAVVEILVADLLIMEFNAKKELVDFDLIAKKHTKIGLPSGYEMVSTNVLGYYIKSIGAFDYAFTSRDSAKDKFDVVYIDYNRREEKKSAKSDVMVGVVSFRKGVKEANRVPINSNATEFRLQPAKPGFISLSEYYRKEKKISLRLEQISY